MHSLEGKIRIDIQQASSEHYRFTEQLESWIEFDFAKKIILYSKHFYADVDIENEETGIKSTEEIYRHGYGFIKFSTLIACDIWWNEEEEKWELDIVNAGVKTLLAWSVKERKLADEIYDILMEIATQNT